MFRVDPICPILYNGRMDGRLILQNELHARKTRNSSYSLRAFARDLGVSPAALSQYLARKRELSRKNRELIFERLQLSPAEQGRFAEQKTISREALRLAKIEEDRFRAISDWLSFAVLSLARLPNCSARPVWIAERLGVTREEAAETVQRLARLGMVEIDGATLSRSSENFATTTDVPSEAIKRYHLSLLRKSETALLECPVELRDITAITMPTDPQKLAAAKKILATARRRVASLLSSGPSTTEIYSLAIQLFPLTQQGNQKS